MVTIVKKDEKEIPSLRLLSEKNLNSSYIFCSSVVLNVLTNILKKNTYPFNELLFVNQVRCIGIKFMEQPVSPVPVFMKEKQEVLQA